VPGNRQHAVQASSAVLGSSSAASHTSSYSLASACDNNKPLSQHIGATDLTAHMPSAMRAAHQHKDARICVAVIFLCLLLLQAVLNVLYMMPQPTPLALDTTTHSILSSCQVRHPQFPVNHQLPCTIVGPMQLKAPTMC
jgi:hypothetical protein